MALFDASRDYYFEQAKQRWMEKGFGADILDILDDCRKNENKRLSRFKVNLISSFLMRLYDYDHETLQLDVTKLLTLDPQREFPVREKRKLLQVLWATIQIFYVDDWAEILNEVNRLAEWNRSIPEELPIK